MKKYAIAIVFLLWMGVFALGGRGRYSSIWKRVSGGIEYRGGNVTISNGILDSSGGVRDLIPDANDTYDLGSATKKWKELYLMGSSLHIGAYTLEQDATDNDGLEIDGALHAAIVGGKSGNFCIHEANEPTASNDSTGSRLWVDPNGVLQHQKSSNAGGGSKQVIVDDGAGNVGIGTTDPKRQFDFDGADVRTQRYLDSDLNTNLGYETFGAENLSGTHNSAFGRLNLYSITSGSGNSGLGNETLYGVTTGSNNVGVGSMSGKGVSGGSHNISLGYKSGYVVADGDNNISIGSYSNYVGTGSKNIIIGYNIDLPIDAGNNQLNIGNLIYGTGLDGVDKAVSAGKVGIGDPSPDNEFTVRAAHAASVTEGTYMKIVNSIGNDTGRNTGILLQGYDGTNYLKTGIFARTIDTFIRQDLIFALETTQDNSNVDTSDAKMTIKGDTGNVEIVENLVIPEGKNITDGTNSRLSIQSGNTSIYGDGNNFLRVIGDASIRSGGDFGGNADNTYSLGWSGVRWTAVWATNGTIQTSDLREKNANYDFEYGLDEVLNLSPISFTWKTGEDTSTHLGLGAQDIQKVIPEIVRGKDRLALNYMELIPVLIKATQEQQKQIDELTKRIERLENDR